MYRVIGRETIGPGRPKRFVVEFSAPWPRGANRVYLVGTFLSLTPGGLKLVKLGNRGYARIPLYPGIYGYGFSVDGEEPAQRDPEVGDVVDVVEPFNFSGKLTLSRLEIKVPEEITEYVIHDEHDPAYMHRFAKYLVVRLRTSAKVGSALLEVLGRGTFEPSTVRRFGKEKVFEYVVDAKYLGPVISYVFLLENGLAYGREGVGERPSPLVISLNEVHGVESPPWYAGAIYYSIFVDSFHNGNPLNDPPTKVAADGASPRAPGYYGGDLEGVAEKVDYIKSLGVDVVYLTPIFEARTYHRYDVVDFMSVDRYAGGNEAFELLVARLRERGMRLVLDIPARHTSACHEFFVDALEKGRNSKYYSWYKFREEPPKDVAERWARLLEECDITVLRSAARELGKAFYESFSGSWYLPSLNYEEPEVREYMKSVLKKWVEAGADGLRIDVAHAIPLDWAEEAAKLVKEFRRDAVFIAEATVNVESLCEIYDSAMNYPLRQHLIMLFWGRETAAEFVEKFDALASAMPHQKFLQLYNMLGSHDTVRISTLVSDVDALRALYAILFSLPGSPAIYYGDEIGLPGNADPDNRRPMPWDRRKWNVELLEHLRTLARLRKEVPELRLGFARLHACGNVLAIERWLDGQAVVLVNTRPEIAQLNGCLGNIGKGPYEAVYGDGRSSFEALWRYGFLFLISRRPA
ncbi:MAG: glycoside hydrolase family 13 protein [Desulfurococcaceae archaeon]